MATRKPSDVDHLYTPQLAGASKTFVKMNQKPFQHRLTDVNASLDLIPQLKPKRHSDVHEVLQKQRELAENTLKRASAKFANMLKTPAREDSTISESDVLRVSGMSSFDNDVHVSSTPRASAKDSLDVQARHVVEESRRQSQMIDALIHKLKTSDITISDVCKEFEEKMNLSVCSDLPEIDSNCFVPSELALEKIKADELSWRKEKDIPVEHFTEFSAFSDGSFKDKVSVGEFFQQRSEDIRSLIPNASPEKTHYPVPLVESSSTLSVRQQENSARDYSLSTTEIAKLLSEMRDENPSAFISHLLKNKKPSLGKENVSPNTEASRSSATHLRIMPTASLNSTACQTDMDSDVSPRTGQHDKSLSSLRSGSALSSLPGGKLPIEATRSQLIWGCVKLGKSSVQEFVVRNRSQNRLRMQVTTSSMEFKLLRDRNESEPLNTLKMLLRPLESRTLAVNFCPSARAAFAGVLDFAPLNADLQQTKRQTIFLYGYGGHATIDLHHNIARDATGKFLLPLGDLNNRTFITKTITCRNSGNLSGFLLATFEAKSGCSSVSVCVVPNKFVIEPQQEIALKVTYTVTKDDYKYFQNSGVGNVFELGVIKVYTEAEALRGRLRRLAVKAENNKLEVKPIVRELTKTFTNEHFPEDLAKLKENVCGMNQLLRQVFLREVVVIIEHDRDSTIVPIDETSVFQTLCQDSNNCSTLLLE